jgi:hypothetical protein
MIYSLQQLPQLQLLQFCCTQGCSANNKYNYIPSSNLLFQLLGNYDVIYVSNYAKVQGLDGAFLGLENQYIYVEYLNVYPANTLQAEYYLL